MSDEDTPSPAPASTPLDGPGAPVDPMGSEAARVARYAEAINRADDEALARTNFRQLGADYAEQARAVVAVADEEHAALVARAEAADEAAERRLNKSIEWMKRAEAAEAKAGVLLARAETAEGRFAHYRDSEVPALMSRAEAERDQLSETVTRLNRRAQIAEAAIHELTHGTGQGKARAVAAEMWERCQAAHERGCERARAAEAKVAKVEALWSDADVTWRCSACGWVASEETIESALWHEAGRTVSMICPECSAEGAFVDHEPLVETISALVHEAWMKSKAAQGVTSRPSEWGEEQMVPYADLSERAKDLDRGSVRAVLDALRAALADAPAESGPGDATSGADEDPRAAWNQTAEQRAEAVGPVEDVEWRVEIGCPVAVAAADAAVDTDRPSIQAQALREAAKHESETFSNCPECLHAKPWIVAWLEERADQTEGGR